MKIKLLVLAMVIISLVSVASADHIIGASPASATIDTGEEQIFMVTISAVPDEDLPNTFSIMGADDFVVEIDGVATTSVDWDWEGVQTFEVKIANVNAPNGNYVITFENINGEDSSALQALVQVSLTAIPEFPTIALPIAAILGLAFFMQRRKEE
ncbi:PEF-CTERM sorting domain-containing protein [Methanolobus sp. WCC5]|uniref:PEF-CTERM sorting domain-containing protein n=1 Tax=Methanolobus sp. WCC5 TaxID=3125785 RepID=UPI0032471AD3